MEYDAYKQYKLGEKSKMLKHSLSEKVIVSSRYMIEFPPEMVRLINREVKITEIVNRRMYHIDLDGGKYLWEDKYFKSPIEILEDKGLKTRKRCHE